jgi:F1F0 ATPase subunit 2
MRDMLILLLPLLGGISLGAIFFGGLWWTVQRGLSSGQPALWFFLSLLLRIVIALSGFYFLMRGDWRRLLVCLLGFILARFCIMRLTGRQFEQRARTLEKGAV